MGRFVSNDYRYFNALHRPRLCSIDAGRSDDRKMESEDVEFLSDSVVILDAGLAMAFVTSSIPKPIGWAYQPPKVTPGVTLSVLPAFKNPVSVNRREDSNLRPPGPETDSSAYRNVWKRVDS
jgi:hypothetical protein